MSTTLQQVPTGTYVVDPVHSSFGFGVRYNGLATFRSTFDKVDAQLADGALTGSADVRSIVIDEPRFKDHLLAEDFFNVDNTPTITFRSTDIRLEEDGSGGARRRADHSRRDEAGDCQRVFRRRRRRPSADGRSPSS